MRALHFLDRSGLATALALSLACFPAGARAALSNWVERDGLRYARRVDLGPVPVGQPATAVAHLENVGSSPLWIESLTPTCGCTVAKWEPRALAAGEIAKPQIGIEGEDQVGHFRHLVDIVGGGGYSLGEIVATADAFLPADDAAPLWIESGVADLGAYPPLPRVPLSLTLRANGGPAARTISWVVEHDGNQLATGAGSVEFDAGVGRLDLQIPRPRSIWGGRVRLRDASFETVVPLLGYPTSPYGAPPACAMRWSGFSIEGLAGDPDEPRLDFGELRLGEVANRRVLLCNVSADTVALPRAFTSSEDDFAVDAPAGPLPPGGRAVVEVTYRGRGRPGSFRSFVHLLGATPGSARLRLACAGLVRGPREAGYADGVVAFRIGMGGPRGTVLALEDDRGVPIARIPTLDHAAYRRAVARGANSPGELCTNCLVPATIGQAPPPHVAHRGQSLQIYSVLGDELQSADLDGVVPWIADPNNCVIRALHPAGFDPDHPTALAIVVFHDELALPEEAARRTRVPAVYIAAAATSAPPLVVPSRDVLLFRPAGAGSTSALLTVYVRDSRILHWESTPPPGS